MSGLLTGLRSYGSATRFHLRDLTRVRAEVVLNFVIPIFYASIAYFIYTAGGQHQSIIDLMIGAGLMGMWSAILFGSGTAIKNQRMLGTLEFLLGAPKRFALIIAPMTSATSVFGASAIAGTCLWGALIFGADFRPSNLPGMVVAAVITALSMSAFGLLLAALFVQVRRAESLASPMLAPLWMLSGIFFPVTAMPGLLQPLGRAFPISWGADAIRAASTGGNFLAPAIWCAALGVVYAAVGSFTINSVAKSARRKGEANLW